MPTLLHKTNACILWPITQIYTTVICHENFTSKVSQNEKYRKLGVASLANICIKIVAITIQKG
jgi:hypothetical protein